MENWVKVKDLFAEAIEQPADLRLKFLKSKCNGDDLLFDEVSSLLAASTEPENLIENNALDLAANVTEPEPNYTDRHFGNYRIIREIGSGGMGTVFLAERDDGEFTMEVALKIVRQSVADREIIARFKRERQILAGLQHSNIAVLHDGGLSEKGEPYLAMEYIEGETLIEYADAHQLSISDMLRLFLKVCSAVSYAHRNLVVHRDLKPSNILVTAGGEPKLLDFGLAKAFESDASKTQTALRAFTPAYASPEQIQGKNITTASDVYSLGVIFYELLCGAKPLQFEDKSFEEILQTINASNPVPPSEIFARPGPEASNRVLRGDLDNIALMALRKEPERRYRSVEDFADDIERHLAGRPISACPSTLGYLTRKFIQRNKIAVGAALLILIAVISGLTISLWQTARARRQAERSQAVNQFMQKMLMTAIPESGKNTKRGSQATIFDVLKDAETRLDEDLSSEPEVRAELRQLIGEGYFTQGMYDDAERNLTQALNDQSTIYGRESRETLKSEFSLASLYFSRAEYDKAWYTYDRRIPAFRSEFQDGKIEFEFYLTKMSDFALACRAKGDAERAEAILREIIGQSKKLSLDARTDTAGVMLTLILLDQGRFEEAKLVQISLVAKLRQSVPSDDPVMPQALTLLGSILMEIGELNDAKANLTEAEVIYRKLYGPDYRELYDNVRLQSQVAYLLGDYPNAHEKIAAVLGNYQKNTTSKYISFATALTIKGLILNKLGKRDEAETVIKEALRLRTENLPPEHFFTALTKGALGEVLLDEKKYAGAEPYLRESLASLSLSQKTENARLKLARDRLTRLESRQPATGNSQKDY